MRSASPCLGEALETPKHFLGYWVLVLQIDFLAQRAEVAIRREQRRCAVVLCERKVERIIHSMTKQPCHLERSLHGRTAGAHVADPAMFKKVLDCAVRFLSIDLPTFRQDPASSERQLIRHEKTVFARQARGDRGFDVAMARMVLDQKNGEDVQVDELTLHPRTRPPPPLGKPPFPTSDRLWPCTVSGRLASSGFLLVRRPPRVGPLRSDRVPLSVPWG